MDKSKRQQSSKNSEARKDNAFRPVEWTFSPMEEALVAVHETDRRAGRGIIVRDEPLKEEFQIRYNKGSKGLVGSINTEDGVELLRQTILHYAGVQLPPTSPAHSISAESDDSRPSTPIYDMLDADQRETLFKAIFKMGGRVPVIGRPEWRIIIHKSPVSKLVHLCLEKTTDSNRDGMLYIAYRLCTEPGCYSYTGTVSNDVLPKCHFHSGVTIHSVLKATDYSARSTLIQRHVTMQHSVKLGATNEEKDDVAELRLTNSLQGVQTWKDYRKRCTVPPIPRSIARVHYSSHDESLQTFALSTTIGMFQQLASNPGQMENLDDTIPFAHGMELLIEGGLNQLGMALKIRRTLSKEEMIARVFPYFEYLVGVGGENKKIKGKAYLYAAMSHNMVYFGWREDPDLSNRLREWKTDGLGEYLRHNPPSHVKTTCYLVGRCDDKDKERFEAHLHIAGFIAYLLGLRNPIRPNSSKCFSSNKCTNLSLLGPDSWKIIREFVMKFWGCEIMFEKVKE